MPRRTASPLADPPAISMAAVIALPGGARARVCVQVTEAPGPRQGPPVPRVPTVEEWPAIIAAMARGDFESLTLTTHQEN